MVLELDVRRSDKIFWKRKVLNDLLGVVVRIGKRTCKSLFVFTVSQFAQLERLIDTDAEESITSLRRSRTRLPTIFSRSSDSNSLWCNVRICLSSSGKFKVISG